MGKYNKLGNNEFLNTQDPLSPPRPFDDNNDNENENLSKNLTPNPAFPIVKNKIFEMYDIHPENGDSRNK